MTGPDNAKGETLLSVRVSIVDGEATSDIATGHLDGQTFVDAAAMAICSVLKGADEISKASGKPGSLRNAVIDRVADILDAGGGKCTHGRVEVTTRAEAEGGGN